MNGLQRIAQENGPVFDFEDGAGDGWPPLGWTVEISGRYSRLHYRALNLATDERGPVRLTHAAALADAYRLA